MTSATAMTLLTSAPETSVEEAKFFLETWLNATFREFLKENALGEFCLDHSAGTFRVLVTRPRTVEPHREDGFFVVDGKWDRAFLTFTREQLSVKKSELEAWLTAKSQEVASIIAVVTVMES